MSRLKSFPHLRSISSSRVEDSTVLVRVQAFVWGASEVKLATPARIGRCVAQLGRLRDQQLQQEGKLLFQLQGAHVSPTGGLSGSRCTTPQPGQSCVLGEAIKPQEC